MTTTPSSSNYDYTASARLERERALLKQGGGARVETNLNAAELAHLDAYVEAGGAASRRAALRQAVLLLPVQAHVNSPKKPRK